MREYLARRLLNVSECFGACYLELTGSDEQTDDFEGVSDGQRHRIVSALRELQTEARTLGLELTSKYAEHVIAIVSDKQKDGDRLSEEVGHLGRWLDQEIESLTFLFIPKSRLHFYRDTILFGEVVADSFPGASYDIQEAGKCFALGRYTASVLHLMRVLETGLYALCKKLKVPFGEKKSWNGVLIDLQSKWKKIEGRKRKPAKWRMDRQFYSEVFVEFGHLKDAWRNYAMHARATYDEERAEVIMNHVKTLMRHLATKLKE